jgi:hypothetical protein
MRRRTCIPNLGTSRRRAWADDTANSAWQDQSGEPRSSVFTMQNSVRNAMRSMWNRDVTSSASAQGMKDVPGMNPSPGMPEEGSIDGVAASVLQVSASLESHKEVNQDEAIGDVQQLASDVMGVDNDAYSTIADDDAGCGQSPEVDVG